MRCIGGPMDGEGWESEASILTLEGHTGRYVRWWDPPTDYDPEWFIRGLPEPAKPECYYLWQGPGEERDHPAVIAIRDVVREASDRHLGRHGG